MCSSYGLTYAPYESPLIYFIIQEELIRLYLIRHKFFFFDTYYSVIVIEDPAGMDIIRAEW